MEVALSLPAITIKRGVTIGGGNPEWGGEGKSSRYTGTDLLRGLIASDDLERRKTKSDPGRLVVRLSGGRRRHGRKWQSGSGRRKSEKNGLPTQLLNSQTLPMFNQSEKARRRGGKEKGRRGELHYPSLWADRSWEKQIKSTSKDFPRKRGELESHGEKNGPVSYVAKGETRRRRQKKDRFVWVGGDGIYEGRGGKIGSDLKGDY